MLDGIDEAVERLKIIQSQNRSSQDREILDWLSTAPYSDPQENNYRRRASNTGNWLLDLPKYQEWKFSPGGLCWLYGAVIQDIEGLCKLDSSRKYAYWYFQFSNDETQKVHNMVRSILRQFMPRTLPASMIKLWEDHSHRGSKPQQEKLTDIFDSLLDTSDCEFFLVLDALDECPTKEHDGRSLLLQFLKGLVERHRAKIHVLVTSRPEPDIRSKLEQYPSVNLESGLRDDVETFVRAQVSHGRLSKWEESIQNLTLERLLDIPEWRFRWADLQIKRLEESKTKNDFIKALDSIPVTLEDSYRDTLERLSPNDREAARKILIWLSFSFVPLDLKTVAAVVSFRFPEDVVTTCTTSLVTVSVSDDTVRLAHFSVREFLVRSESEGQWYQFSAISGHGAIANQTIDLLLETTEILTSTAMQAPLLMYAARYWDLHFMELRGLHESCTGFQERVDRLFTERDVYFNWIRLLNSKWGDYWNKSLEEQERPLLIASKKGLKPTVETLLARGEDPLESNNDLQWNSLAEAAQWGQLEILELLLDKVKKIPRETTVSILQNMDIVKPDQERLGNILDLLWDKGALHDRSRTSNKVLDETLAENAAENSTSGHLLISLLLDRKKRMGFKLTEELLKSVLWNGGCAEQIMHLLLSRCGADIKLTPSLIHELMLPVRNGAPIALLNDRLQDIVVDETCVATFAQGKKETMELLLQHRGEEVKVTQKVLVTAARRSSDPRTVRLLLKKREPEAIIDKEILLAATENEDSSGVFDVLLDECGQDTIIDDTIMQSILQNRWEGLAMIKMLLCRQQAGFLVTQQTLCNAAEHQNREMMEFLVNNADGSDLPITENTLHSVTRNMYLGPAVMECLFDLRGHNLPVSENVLVATAYGCIDTADDVLRFLLERWPDIPVSDQLLEAACHLPDSKSMELLLDRRCDDLPIEKMITKIGRNYSRGFVLGMLLDRQLVEVDEWLMETVASNSGALEAIYDRNLEVPVTQKMIINAVDDVSGIRFLLNKQNNQILITEEVIKASLWGRDSESVIRLFLTRLGPEEVPITEEVLKFAVENGTIEPLEMLLEQGRDLNLNLVWEAIWQDPGFDPFFASCAARVVLQYHSFDISVEILGRLPAECYSEYVFDDFVRSCMQHRVLLPTSEAVFELIVERSSLNTIDIFLEDHPDISITERCFEAAEMNPREDVNRNALSSLRCAEPS
ncbi:unnamed protein product [Penicillium bialowiezense]